MKFKTALIGCGRISHKHIEGLVNNREKARLVAVCDLIEERALAKRAEYLEAFPDDKVSVFTDYRRLLDEVKPDLVNIATESGFHSVIAIDALEAGANVIVEKPMALSTFDADRMIATSKRTGKALTVCYQNRYNPPIRRLYGALTHNRFGRIMNGTIHIRWNRNEQYYLQAPWRGTWEHDGGTLMNQCTHGIDLLQWVLGGDIKSVYGVTRRFIRPIEAEDFGTAIVEFANGAVGVIEGSADVFPRNLCETLSVFGEKGTAVIGGIAVNRIETWRFSDSEEWGDPEELVIDPHSSDPPSVYGFGHSGFFAEFLSDLEQGKEPFISGEEGKKSMDIVLAVYKSVKEKKPVDFPVDFDTARMKGYFD
jgi:predicted dehydrogenase